MATNVYEMITKKMIEQLNNGIIPWQRPWIGGSLAVSHTNGKPYSLLNQFLLDNMEGEWLTYSQIENEGGHVKRGEKSHFVVFWKFLPKYGENEEGEKIVIGQFPMLKYYNVWHISQVEGVKEKYPSNPKFDNTPIESAEKIITDYIERENLPLRRDNTSERAFYSPATDCVTVPKIEQFKVVEEYYSTLFHELTHSTGAEKRLNRDGIVKFDHFGSEQYSKEELIAEMGAAFLINIAGIECDKAFKNSVGYLQSWLKALQNDPKMIVAAASKAEQAVKYIISGERPKADE